MTTIVLKIGFPPGSATKIKLTKLKITTTVKETISEIVKSNKLSNPEQFALLLPPPSSEMNALWLEEGRLLSSYPLQPRDLIELRKLNQVIKIYFSQVYQRVLININQPLAKAVPLIAKKFQIENTSEFTLHLRKNGAPVDLGKSVREQNLSTDAVFTLMKRGEEIVDVLDWEEDEEDRDKEVEEEEEASSKPEEENSDPPDQRAAKSHKNPQKVGLLKFKKEAKKKFEERWFVLKDDYLYEYKSQNVCRTVLKLKY